MNGKYKIWLLLLSLFFQCDIFAMESKWALDGFIRNNTGFFTEDFDYSKSDDSLATERNWFRLNLNGEPVENIRITAELLAIWEPEYGREKGSGIPANEYNSLDSRELRIDWTPTSSHSFRLGKQIVNWGESLSTRVGDVINPQDQRFDLGFTNLEDSRMPIWMLRAKHYISGINAGLEWIFAPYLEPDRYRVNRGAKGPTVFTNGSFIPGGRFQSHPETRTEALGGLDNLYLYYPGVGALPASSFGLPILGPPLNKSYQFMPANAFGPGSPSGYYFLHTPSVDAEYPGSSLNDSRYGFRTEKTISGTQMGFYFWHGNEFSPVIQLDNGVPTVPGRPLNATLIYPTQNIYGFFANKNTNFAVFRMDSAFRPKRNYNSMDYDKHPNAIAEKDNLIVQLGLDKSFYWPKLNSQTFGLIFEYVGEFILDDLDDLHVPNYYVPYHKDAHQLMAQFKTNFNFGMYEPSITVIHYFTGCGLIQPKFVYKPDWMNNKWEFTLQYNHVWAENEYTFPMALKENEDMILLTTQFSFP